MDSICGLLLINTENSFHSILCLKKQQSVCLQKYTNKGCQWGNHTVVEYTLQIYNYLTV